ncbi:MAG TPA: hypothetical protein VF688_13835, partial [Allosphingosinicella sp.]
MASNLEDLLERIDAVGGRPPHENDSGSLLHAYVACLNFADLCAANLIVLDGPVDVRLALRGRLIRLLHQRAADEDGEALAALVDQTAAAAEEDKGLRQRADALHSALFAHLPLPTQQLLLERWAGRGTRGVMARWLKATKDHPELFDAQIALSYWRATRDARAAKSLAYQAPPEQLGPITPEIIAVCEEGWIISKAVIRGGLGDDTLWDAIREGQPATYLYLCARTERQITDDEAFDLVCRCPGIAIHGDRGLGIWAVG